MEKKVLNPMMLFVGFYLLMEEEKASGRRKNLLYKKVLGKELGAEEFENLYKRFREAFETKNIRFYDTYQWFENRNAVAFAANPEQKESRARFSDPIQPKFILEEDRMIVKLEYGQADVASCYGRWFCMSQGCYPFYKWEYPVERVSNSKRYAQRLLNATKKALQSF